MTYNFDAERWLADHRAALRARHERGELDDNQLVEALAALERRHEALVARLDGTYALPPASPPERADG